MPEFAELQQGETPRSAVRPVRERRLQKQLVAARRGVQRRPELNRAAANQIVDDRVIGARSFPGKAADRPALGTLVQLRST
jgi:hypothetical protein